MRDELANALTRFADRTAAVLEDGRKFTYAELEAEALRISEELPNQKSLLLLAGGNSWYTLAAYVAGLTSGHLVHVVDWSQGGSAEALVSTYRPEIVIRCRTDGYSIDRAINPDLPHVHNDLALLFTTSGSTGSKKLVKITRNNLLSNTLAIIEYLGMGPEDRAITLLKPHYSFGLSIINSHLLCGGSLLLTDRSIQDPDIWSLMDRFQVTNFSGVPHTFEVIAKDMSGLAKARSLRFVTQAGGKLQRDLVQKFAQTGAQLGWRFFVMYGQTEASPRISYLPPEMALDNPESIGIAIPGGRLELEGDDGEAIYASNVDGELIYFGPNIMAGYARSRDELAFIEHNKRLATGDIARRKENGLFVITGRKSRFIKPLGIRISLDEIEEALRQRGLVVATLAKDERMLVVVENDASVNASDIGALLSLAPSLVQVAHLDKLPRLDNGKIDYASLGKIETRGQKLSLWLHPFRFVKDVSIEFAALLLGNSDPTRSIAEIYRNILQVDTVAPADSFITLSGDSMSYVEMSVVLGDVLGTLPDSWHILTIMELEQMRRVAE